MNKKHSIFLATIASVCCYAAMIFLSGGCAQIGMPMGGPKDSLPPVLTQASPSNHALNFKGNRISLTFDEYIQLDNPLKNVIVSPLPKKNPFIDFKLKTVSVKLFDTLKPNTTYSIQFGNTIRDLNENNPLAGFDYVFSTGSYIDSLQFAGQVTLAETGTVDSNMIVTLYSDLGDSAVYKHKPDYITRVDKEGKFLFRNLSPGSYAVFAIKDESGQYVYNNPSQLFAFADSVVHPSISGGDRIHLYGFQEEKPFAKTTTPKETEELKYTTAVRGGAQDLLSPLEVNFNHQIKSIDTTGFYIGDTLLRRLPGQSLSIDSTRRNVFVKYNWTGSTDYDLVILKDAVTDSTGKELAKNDTLRFKTKNESDYGSLKLNFKNLEKYQNPVLQLVNEKGEVNSYPLAGNVFDKKLVVPGTYNIQILEDRNKNGKWDPGKYSQRLQPEEVHRITQNISIRANWDNERDIIL